MRERINKAGRIGFEIIFTNLWYKQLENSIHVDEQRAYKSHRRRSYND